MEIMSPINLGFTSKQRRQYHMTTKSTSEHLELEYMGHNRSIGSKSNHDQNIPPFVLCLNFVL